MKNASQRFFEFGIMEAFNISPQEWSEMTIPTRAEIMVYAELKNKLEFVERYEQEMYYEQKSKEDEEKRKNG